MAVDRSTGSVRVVQHLTFDDFGTVLDPSALTAQTEGGVLQSIGEAFQEEVEYDRNCRLSNSYHDSISLGDTQVFSHVPMRLTTSQHLHGARGAGEAGRIGSLPAIVNAVENALAKVGVNAFFLSSTPISSESICALATKE